MSDFLTNLVIRSFSRTPSFQPLAPAVANPTPVGTTDNTDKTDQEMPPQPPRSIRREVVTADSPKTESVSYAIEPPQPEPEKFVIPPAVETPAPVVKTTVLERPIPPPPAIPSQPSKPEVVTRERVNTITSPSPVVAPPQRRPLPTVKTRKAEPPVIEQVIENVTEHVTRNVTEQHVTTQHLTEQHLTEHVIERPSVTIENNQELTTSFTTLIPKPTAQALPSVNVKARPNLPAVKQPAEPEPPTLPPETVINVAIGRIEVRATPPAAPRREQQSTGPKVMTLDDYVQQRSRGAK